jgi:hypothetical protein
MKNVISIDIDTERDSIIKFGKPTDFVVPTNIEEQKKMVDDDIITLTAGLTELIRYAGKTGLGIKEEYKDFIVKSIDDIK